MPSPSPFFPALLVLACAAGGRAQDAPKPAPVVAPLAFQWPLPARAVVVKDGEKKGNQVKMRFRLDVTPEAKGELRARMTQFEFLEVGGRDATTPEMMKAMQPALALAQAVPDIVADEKGVYRRMDGLDAMVKRVSEHMSQQEGRSAEERDTMLRQMQSPAMADLLQQACSLYWNTWAGAWVGFDLAPGTERVDEVETAFFGATFRAKATRRHHGAAADHPDHVRLGTVSVVEGPEAVEAFRTAMTRIAKDSGGKPFPADELESVRQELALEVITDPRTLLPRRAISTKTMRIVMGGTTTEQVERADYTFEWEKGDAEKR